MGLLKNAHTLKGTRRLLCCAANRNAQRIWKHTCGKAHQKADQNIGIVQ